MHFAPGTVIHHGNNSVDRLGQQEIFQHYNLQKCSDCLNDSSLSSCTILRTALGKLASHLIFPATKHRTVYWHYLVGKDAEEPAMHLKSPNLLIHGFRSTAIKV